MDCQIQILPLRGLVFGFLYYDTTHEEDYDEELDTYYEHYTLLLFIIGIRLLRI